MSISVVRPAAGGVALALVLGVVLGAADVSAQPVADGADQARAGGGAHPKECYARVRYDTPPAPPPIGPHYVWRPAPAPPGAPGPVWCLVLEGPTAAPLAPAPERLGWIRVMCAEEVTPARVRRLQHGLAERGLYGGRFDGRYDAQTATAVSAFQNRARIPHAGYLSYRTYSALSAPAPYAWRAPTTFDTGVLDWPGKVRGF